MNDGELRNALRDIIEGKGVKRSKHELMYSGRDVRTEFIEELVAAGYLPTTVGKIDITPGERVPAFHLDNHTAFFGWVFWEKFTQLRLRKLFGTVVRNAKGDWMIQIPPNSPRMVYAQTQQIFEMDIDHPFEL